MPSVDRADRMNEAHSLADLIPAERRRIMDAATPQRREQMRAAEASRGVYRAWNAVCAGSREGAHVTGLHYVPESNELIVYADGSSWVGELTMMREIIRARMHRCGVDIADIKVKLSRGDYAARAARLRATASASQPHGADAVHTPGGHRKAPAPPAHPLTHEQDARLDAEVSPIGDARLREALKKAMKASLEHKIPSDGKN